VARFPQSLDGKRRGLPTSLLTALSDVDRPEDLPVWQRTKGGSLPASNVPRISIVIPALNEASNLADSLSAMRGVQNIETIVVDGGSCDGTDSLALDRGALLIRSAAGRARQMNAGAQAAAGEILLFLHAGTRLPERFDEQVRELLVQPGVVAGAFRLRIDGARRAFRLIEWMVNLRSRWLQMPYGDQAIFLRSDIFHRSGGFPELAIMEDFEFIRRLRRHGKIAIASASATTSARRWEMLGPWRTTWINHRIILGHRLGICPDTLAKWYAGSRSRPARQ
jgi:rSAM/selenodomain-associated transferase 2